MADPVADMLERHNRRMRSMIALGKVLLVDDGGNAQQAQIRVGAYEVHGAPRLTEYGFSSSPPAGSDAVVLYLGGDRGNPMIISTGHQTYRLKVAGGEVAISDDQGQAVHLTRAGIVVRGAGFPVTISGTPKLRVEGDIEATGDIRASADSGPVHMLSHVHGGVQSGSSSTAKPNAGS